MGTPKQDILDLLSKEAKQDDVIAALGLLGTEAKLELIRLLLAGTLTVGGEVEVSNHPSSTEVSNFPTSTEVSNFPTTQDVQVTGSIVEVDGVTYQVSGGNTLRGTNAIKPTAPLAHAAIPYCFYFAIDIGTVEATDGTDWVVI